MDLTRVSPIKPFDESGTGVAGRSSHTLVLDFSVDEDPPWANQVLRSKTPNPAPGRRWDLNWKRDRTSGLQFAQVPGATLVILEEGDRVRGDKYTGKAFKPVPSASAIIPSDALALAQDFLSRCRSAHFELGVLVLGSGQSLSPDQVQRLAEDQVVVADDAEVRGTSAIDRAQHYADLLRQRAERQRKNFEQYVKRVQSE